jgi:hypothetical protein
VTTTLWKRMPMMTPMQDYEYRESSV